MEDAHSSPRSAATRFSPITSLIPAGTLPVTPIQLTEPFWIPCEPAPLVTYRHLHSRYSIDFFSLHPISTSEPEPEVNLTFRPLDA